MNAWPTALFVLLWSSGAIFSRWGLDHASPFVLLALLDARARDQLRTLPIFVPHQRIAELAVDSGLQRVVLTAAADAGIIASLCSYAWPEHA